jgi:predicted CopG family antitoxin
MARSVSLSDEAFAALRREKRPHESDSDVVLRLQRAAHARQRDPLSFFRRPPRAEISPAEHEQFIERMDEADRERHPGWDDDASP